MNRDALNKVIALVNTENPRRCEVSNTKASTSAIAKVEARLGVSFHEDYVDFLVAYGSLIVSDCCISGLWNDDPDSTSRGTVLGETLNFRKRFENVTNKHYTVLENEDDEWYVLMNHEDGMVYSFDPFSESLERTNESFYLYVVDFLNVFV